MCPCAHPWWFLASQTKTQGYVAVWAWRSGPPRVTLAVESGMWCFGAASLHCLPGLTNFPCVVLFSELLTQCTSVHGRGSGQRWNLACTQCSSPADSFAAWTSQEPSDFCLPFCRAAVLAMDDSASRIALRMTQRPASFLFCRTLIPLPDAFHPQPCWGEDEWW